MRFKMSEQPLQYQRETLLFFCGMVRASRLLLWAHFKDWQIHFMDNWGPNFNNIVRGTQLEAMKTIAKDLGFVVDENDLLVVDENGKPTFQLETEATYKGSL